MFFLGKLEYLIFDIINFGIKLLDGLIPPPIEIPADKRTPIIAMNDAIRIDHGKDLKNKLIPKYFGLNII